MTSPYLLIESFFWEIQHHRTKIQDDKQIIIDKCQKKKSLFSKTAITTDPRILDYFLENIRLLSKKVLSNNFLSIRRCKQQESLANAVELFPMLQGLALVYRHLIEHLHFQALILFLPFFHP